MDVGLIKKTVDKKCKEIFKLIFNNLDNVDAIKIISERKGEDNIKVKICSFGIRDDSDNPFYHQDFKFSLIKKKRKMNPNSIKNLMIGKRKRQESELDTVNKNEISKTTVKSNVEVEDMMDLTIISALRINNITNDNEEYNKNKDTENKKIKKRCKKINKYIEKEAENIKTPKIGKRIEQQEVDTELIARKVIKYQNQNENPQNIDLNTYVEDNPLKNGSSKTIHSIDCVKCIEWDEKYNDLKKYTEELEKKRNKCYFCSKEDSKEDDKYYISGRCILSKRYKHPELKIITNPEDLFISDNETITTPDCSPVKKGYVVTLNDEIKRTKKKERIKKIKVNNEKIRRAIAENLI